MQRTKWKPQGDKPYQASDRALHLVPAPVHMLTTRLSAFCIARQDVSADNVGGGASTGQKSLDVDLHVESGTVDHSWYHLVTDPCHESDCRSCEVLLSPTRNEENNT